jgi:hypothetical protein
MSMAIAAQGRLRNTLEALDKGNRELSNLLKKVESDVSNAVRVMQFEDIVTQLLCRVSGEVDALGAAFSDFLSAMIQLDPPGLAEASASALERVRGKDGGLGVSQENMDDGGVELF